MSNVLLNNKCFFVVLASIFLIMGCFNYLTPMAADDYCYSLGKISTLSEIFKETWNEYFTWNSRFISLFLARFLLTCSKTVNIIVNTSVFCGILVFCTVLVHGAQWKQKLSAVQLVFLFCLIWFTVPAFGTVFLWRNGLANYAYPLFFMLFFFVPYRFLLENPEYKPGKLMLLCLGLVSVPAGLSNENSGIIVFLLAAGLCFLLRKRGYRIPSWAIFGALAVLAGWLTLILAPGPYVRLQHPFFLEYREMTWFGRIEQFFPYMVKWQMLLAPQYALVGAVFWYNRHEVVNKNYCILTVAFLVAAILALGAFVLSVVPPNRALTSAFVFCSIAAYASLFIYDGFYDRLQRLLWVKVFFVILCIGLCVSIGVQFNIFYAANNVFLERLQILQSGEKDLIVKPYKDSNKYFFIGEEISDVHVDANDWVNVCVSKYFNIHSIRVDNTIDIDVPNAEYVYNEGGNSLQAVVTQNVAILNSSSELQGRIYIYYKQRSITTKETFRSLMRNIIDPSVFSYRTMKLFYKYAIFQKDSTGKRSAFLEDCDFDKGVYIIISGKVQRVIQLLPHK